RQQDAGVEDEGSDGSLLLQRHRTPLTRPCGALLARSCVVQLTDREGSRGSKCRPPRRCAAAPPRGATHRGVWSWIVTNEPPDSADLPRLADTTNVRRSASD